MTLFELLTASNFITYWEGKDADQSGYLMESKFPVRKNRKLEMKMIRGKANLPVVLEPSAFDANPTLREKVGITSYVHDLPFFREADRYGEQELMDINNAIQLADDQGVTYLLRDLFDYQGELVRGALARLEQMRWQVVLNAGIDVMADLEKGNNTYYKFTFDDTGEWASNNVVTIAGTDAWNVVDSTATGDPIEDIDSILMTAKDNGVDIAELYMNLVTFRTMMNHPKVIERLNPENVLMTQSEKETKLSDYFGVRFVIYDGRYSAVDNADGQYKTYKFIPDGVISLQPAGNLGQTFLGATPEEIGVITSPEVELAQYRGLSVMRFQEGVAPVNHMFVVSFLGMPSFEKMDSVYKLVVF